MRQIVLQPGELALTRYPARISTILGSCVALTMYHATSGMSAMCHCLLASKPVTKLSMESENPRAYLDTVFPEMLAFFRRASLLPEDLQIKLFGGADVLEALSGPRSVGRENIAAAHRLLETHGLQLAACDTGGRLGRRIEMATPTGSVRVRKIGSHSEQDNAAAADPAPLLHSTGMAQKPKRHRSVPAEDLGAALSRLPTARAI